MDNKLKTITDKTLNKLVHNQIILPSVYFKAFNESAQELNIDVFDDNFTIDIENILNEEFEQISSFMDKTIYNIDSLSKATNSVHKAIQNNDLKEIESVTNEIQKIKTEILNIKKLVFVDEVTNTLNRKWIYKRVLNENGEFLDSGVVVLVFINDYTTLLKKHGQSIADNVLIYIAKFLTKEFYNSEFNVDIAKYSDNKFLIFSKDANLTELQNYMAKVKTAILASTLKSKSGITLKTKFDFTIQSYKKGNKFQLTLDDLVSKERG